MGSEIKSDAGWGCMLRVGQMILCEAIKRHLYKDMLTSDERHQDKEYWRIL